MKPKLAVIGLRGYPANFSGSSGVDTYVANIIPFIKDDFEINLYTRQWSNSSSSIFHIHPIFCLNTKYFDTSLYSIMATIQALLDGNDIFWFHAHGSCLLLPLVKIFHKKVVVTFHGIDWQRQKWSNPVTKFILKFLEKIAVNFSDKITVVSHDIFNYINHQYNLSSIETFPGFEPKKIFPSRPYLLYLGRLVPEKNVDLLITAYLQNQTVFSQYQLIISGKLEKNNYCRQLQAMTQSFPQKIIFTDYTSGIKKEKLLRHAQLFVLPSSLEGHSLALNEALSYGLPCLTSNIPIHQELSLHCPNITMFKNKSIIDLQNKLSVSINSPRQINYHQTHKWSTLAYQFTFLFTHL